MAAKTKKVQTEAKLVLNLVGNDGNAWAILGRATRVARKAGWTKDRIDAIMKEATSGDYNDLLGTMMKYFDVT